MRTGQEQEIQVGDFTFVIRKFTPQVACFWATRLFGKLIGSASGMKLSIEDLSGIIEEFITMERKDADMLLKDCLSHVFIRLESGLHPVMNANGTMAKSEIDNPTVLQLIFLAFGFSITDFFAPEALKGVVQGLGGVLGLDLSETPKTT